MSGGKGGEQKSEMDPDFKRAGLEAIETGKQLSKMSPIPYMGLVQAAPSQATRQAWTNVNNSANLLGLGMAGDPADGLPEHERDMGGQKGYTSFRGYSQNLQRTWREFPELMQALEDYMPGVVTPAKVHRENSTMFPAFNQGSTPGQLNPYPNANGMSYENLINAYRGRYGR
jgi:hypothetical protein